MKQTPNTGMHPLRVLLVDNSFDRAASIKHGLHEAGCRIAAHVVSSADLSGLVRDLEPDVVIIDTESPDRDTLDQLFLLSRDQPRPVVIFTHDGDTNKINAAIRAGVSAYVVNGLESERLRPILEVAIARFDEFQALRRELEKTEVQLAGRKHIERAKGILMKHRGWAEEEAYQALRKMAMDRGVKLVDMARQIVTVADMLI